MRTLTFFSLLVVVFIFASMTIFAANDEALLKKAAELRLQVAKSEERVKTINEYIKIGIKFSASLVSNYDYIFKSTNSVDYLSDSLIGVAQQKDLDALLAKSSKITEIDGRLKVISDDTKQFPTKDSTEDLRKTLPLILESTDKSDLRIQEVDTIIKMSPDQVVEKLRKDGLLPPPLQITPPANFDKSKHTISQADLDVLLAQNKAVKVAEFNEMLKPSEKQIILGKSEYIRNASENLSKELTLLYSQLRDADGVLFTDLDMTTDMLQSESTKIKLLKSDLIKYPAE